jgi:hypothetical protein
MASSPVIPDIDWPAATVMLRSYSDTHIASAARRGARAEHDHDGIAIWSPILDAVAQFANAPPSGSVH